MKQGRASRDVLEGWKAKTVPNAINVKGVSQIGSAMGNHTTGSKRILNDVPQPVHAGRGFDSPLGSPGTPGVGGGRKVYNKGSQGRS